MRGIIRKEEEELRAELATKGEQLAALREGAFSKLSSRNTAVDARRLKAIEALWQAAVDRAPLKLLAKTTSALDLDYAMGAAAQKTQEGETIREFAADLLTVAGIDTNQRYPSPTLAPLFAAFGLGSLQGLRKRFEPPSGPSSGNERGIEKGILAADQLMIDVLKSALPHKAAFVDESGADGAVSLIDELE